MLSGWNIPLVRHLYKNVVPAFAAPRMNNVGRAKSLGYAPASLSDRE
jgi:hypothetical protein